MRSEQADLLYILSRIEARQEQILAAVRALDRPAVHLQSLDVLKFLGAAAILWLVWVGAMKPHDVLPYLFK